MAIVQLKNGTWRLVINRPNAPRITKVFKTEKDAQKNEAIIKGQLALGNNEILDTLNAVLKGQIKKEVPKEKEETFEEYLTKWHYDRKVDNEISINHVKRIDEMFRNQIFPNLGSYKLSEINSEKVRILRRKLLKTLSKQTVKNCESIIRKALKDATLKNKVSSYPFSDLAQIKIKKQDRKEIAALTSEQQERLMKIAISYSDKVNDQRRFMLYYMLVNTGMRYGELCGLKWKDIILEKRELKIERQCIFANGNSNPMLSSLKTEKSERGIFLTNEDIKVIKKYRSWVSETILPLNDTPFIQNIDGGHLTKDFGRSTMRMLLRLAKLPHYQVHGLRHTHATNLANTEIPIKILSDRLGHSDITTTMNRYAKSNRELAETYLNEVNIKKA